MSNVGKTLLKGHGLKSEGAPIFTANGKVDWWGEGDRAKCECGALSEPGISQTAAKRWHREHKATVRRAAEETP